MILALVICGVEMSPKTYNYRFWNLMPLRVRYHLHPRARALAVSPPIAAMDFSTAGLVAMLEYRVFE